MKRAAIVVVAAWTLMVCGAADTPFDAAATLLRSSATDAVIAVRVTVPPQHHIYADAYNIRLARGVGIAQAHMAVPVTKYDPLSEEDRAMFERDIVAEYVLTGTLVYPLAMTVRYQGCDESTCYMPEEHEFVLQAEKSPGAEAAPALAEAETGPKGPATEADRGAADRGAAAAATLAAELAGFRERTRGVGYMSAEKFLALLAARDAAPASDAGAALDGFARRGLLLSLLLILLGGLALNLTPCVLPMIPINVAIIGAGVQAGSRLRGSLLGGAYGAGIAVAYGALGVVVVLTGAQFGALNSAVWFNLAIAGVFVVLALAMFDVIQIDFTRFQSAAVGARTKKGGLLTAYVVGTVAALLAGACVAPVVIQVLVLAATLYGRGLHAGLLLPFVLGVGMALPWPLAGAGLSLLPKPGAWMVRVKYAFGVLILLMALWYGHEGYRLWRGPRVAAADALWRTSLPDALIEARRLHKPLVLDFWATWCKNCLAMDAATFKNPAVRRTLAAFVPVKVQTEHFDDPRVKPLVDHFKIIGLPTYIVIEPVQEQ